MLNFDWLNGVPASTAKWIFYILFIGIGILVLLVPNDSIYEGVENPKWYHNIKIWAIGDLLFILIVYAIF